MNLVSQKALLIYCLYMAVSTLTEAGRNKIMNHLDPNIDMPDDLRDKLLELWCNGTNYATLCEGWVDLKLCLGEILPAEMWSIKDDTRLYEYEKEKLGDLLSRMNCSSNKLNLSFYVRESSVQHWIFIIFGICCIISIILTFFGYHNIRKSALYKDDKSENDEIQKDKNIEV